MKEKEKVTKKEDKGKPNKKLLIIIGAFFLLIAIGVALWALGVFQSEEEVTIEEKEEQITEEVVEIEGDPLLVWAHQMENGIRSIAVSPDGETFALGEYLTSYIFHLADASLEQVIVYRHSVEDMEFSPDGNILAGGLTVYGVYLNNPDDGTELQDLHGGYNSRVAFSPDGEYIATGNRTGIVWIWDVQTGEQLFALEEEDTTWINALEYHPSGEYIASTHWGRVGQPGYINIWNIEEEEIVQRIQLNNTIGSSRDLFKYSPTGEIMAYADRDEERNTWVYLLDVQTGEEINKLSINRNPKDLDFSPDGTLLAVNEHTSPTTIWNVETGQLIYTLNHSSTHGDFFREVAFTMDGGHVLVSRADDTLELWRLPGGQEILPRVKDFTNPPPLPSDVLFDTNSSDLKSEADPVLEEFAQELYESLPTANITFVGHTDSRGSADANMKLSLDRARAVREWFDGWVSENNVTGWTFDIDGKGEEDLKVPDVDSEGNFLEEAGKLNRRVEIEIE